MFIYGIHLNCLQKNRCCRERNIYSADNFVSLYLIASVVTTSDVAVEGVIYLIDINILVSTVTI